MDFESIKNTLKELVSGRKPWKIVTSSFSDIKPYANNSLNEWVKRNSQPHSHREVLIPLSGKSFYGLEGNAYPCEYGSFFFFDRMEDHDAIYHPGADKVIHLWLHLYGYSVSTRILDVRKGKLYYPRNLFGRLYNSEEGNLLNRIWDQMKDPASPEDVPFKRAALEASLKIALYSFIQMKPEGTKKKTALKERQREVMASIRKHIEISIGKGLSIDNLAKIAGYSKFHFQRVFKQTSGQTVHEFIDECRVIKVKEMQKKGFLKKEISEALGFSSPIAFSRWQKIFFS